MNIVILGAGTVGTSIAEQLCQNQYNVTVVDSDPTRTQTINDALDVRVLNGNASESSVLFQAGGASVDMLLAVTGVDEVNIVAASMAKAMGAKRSIARVYSPVFRDLSTFDYQKHFGIDRMMSLEHLAAVELARGIRDPSSVVLEQFAHGELDVVEYDVTEKCKATHKKIKDLNLPPNILVGTIKRTKRMWIASAEDQLEAGDSVTIFRRRDCEQALKGLFSERRQTPRRIVIGGGGETGFQLARKLEGESFSITLLETDQERCEVLANSLARTSVIHGDATHREVLEEERVGSADVFVSCLGDDENNIVACVEAREIGAEKVMAIVERSDYGRIIGKLGINLAVSEREVMGKQIMNYLSDGVISSRIRLPGGNIYVLEIDVVPDSAATQSTLAEVGLPKGCLVAAIVQNDFVHVPEGSDQIADEAKVILLVEEDVLHSALGFFDRAHKTT